MLTFSEFLTECFLVEGGKATSKFGTQRATKSDVIAAIKFVAKSLSVDEEELRDSILGSSRLTAIGKKTDSGDIDIAYPLKPGETEKSVHEKMLQAVNGEGTLHSGLRTASYAVPINGKKVQVDLMFVNNITWAKWIYHNDENSKYSGSVRNELLLAALSRAQKPGKDYVEADDSGNLVVRASNAINFATGMRRLFKMAPVNAKTGRRNKTMKDATPGEIQKYLSSTGKNVRISNSEDATDDPDAVAAYIFGPKVRASDLLTAEDVIEQIKKLKNAAEIFDVAKKNIAKRGFTMPSQLK